MAEATEPSLARIMAYVMLDLMPDGATNVDKCVRLSGCGFAPPAISEILGIPIGSVHTNLYNARKKTGAKKTTKKAVKNQTPAKKV